jgi:hypothetical protein
MGTISLDESALSVCVSRRCSRIKRSRSVENDGRLPDNTRRQIRSLIRIEPLPRILMRARSTAQEAPTVDSHFDSANVRALHFNRGTIHHDLAVSDANDSDPFICSNCPFPDIMSLLISGPDGGVARIICSHEARTRDARMVNVVMMNMYRQLRRG